MAVPSATPGVESLNRRVCAGYLALQAVAGIGFWLVFASLGEARDAVELLPGQPAVTDAFIVADALVVVASAVAAWAVARRRPWAVAAAWFTAGGIVYPTLFLLGWVALLGTGTGQGAVCLAVMVPPSLLTTWVAWQVGKLPK